MMTSRTRDDDEEELEAYSMGEDPFGTLSDHRPNSDSEEDQNAVEDQIVRASCESTKGKRQRGIEAKRLSSCCQSGRKDAMKSGKRADTLTKKRRKKTHGRRPAYNVDSDRDSDSGSDHVGSESSSSSSEELCNRHNESDSDVAEVKKQSKRKDVKASAAAKANGKNAERIGKGRVMSTTRGKAEEMSSSESETEYDVEKIVKHRVVEESEEGKVVEYFIKWAGYPASDNTWEPEENLFKAQRALSKYWDSVKAAEKRGTKGTSKTTKKRNGAARQGASRRRLHVNTVDSDCESLTGDEEIADNRNGLNARASRSISEEKEDSKESSLPPSGTRLQDRLLEKDWETAIYPIKQMMRKDGDELLVRVRFLDEPEYYWVPVVEVNLRAPQQMLKFYESKVRFITPLEPHRDVADPTPSSSRSGKWTS